jgi:choline dehydrogenase-like flavoprotein
MPNLLPLLIFLLFTFPLPTLSSPDYLTQSPSNTYDYIVIGSGPGGGTLASNLALSGASILLLEAGDDQGSNLDEEVAGWFFLAYNDPLMRWDFFVKYHRCVSFSHLCGV